MEQVSGLFYYMAFQTIEIKRVSRKNKVTQDVLSVSRKWPTFLCKIAENGNYLQFSGSFIIYTNGLLKHSSVKLQKYEWTQVHPAH